MRSAIANAEPVETATAGTKPLQPPPYGSGIHGSFATTTANANTRLFDESEHPPDEGLGYPFRTVVVFTAALALTVLWLVLPVSRALASLCSAVVGLLALVLVWSRTRQIAVARAQNAHVLRALGIAAADIPVQLRTRMPLVLVTGDGLPALFDRGGEARFAHVGDGAIWLRADRHQDVPRLSVAVRQWRDGRVPDGVVLSIAPALHAGIDVLTQRLRMMREVLADASHMLGARLPSYVAVYQRSATRKRPIGTSEETQSEAAATVSTEPHAVSSAIGVTTPQWYGLSSSERLAPQELRQGVTEDRFESVIQAAETEAQRAGTPHTAATRAAALASLVGWTRRVVLDVLTDGRQPSAPCALYGVGWIDCGPATGPGKPWELEVEAQTAVVPAAVNASPSPWPLPQPLISAMPRRLWVSPRVAALAHAFALTACAAAVAFGAATSNNTKLLDRIGADLRRYAMIPAQHDSAKRDALQALVADRDQLEHFARLGIPLQLSFGLYHGAQLIPVLNDAIATYQSPPAPPVVVTLDSMSLFDSGKAQLKSGSTRAMVSALDMIKSNPGKRILVAGHTDAIGNPDSNLKLSVARAAAVRDWLIDASGIPATQFAIQGYGDTRPIAGNDMPEGREKNRRVEITLVPDPAQ
ncbi:OmpA family protein [Paraburkholderia humisilvae]|uniref:Peptidoglycan-associated lipoprotein n=1 Tax=Paraburkholderia humisilvae TaxID=627669 RepID=A0A6J5D858_9BURK|nr:OmpA family protein [Paraburkholderia humisilvae]CAB3749554.1 Peptidoglycan-associated lipoprotein [Paraburkholderia humisilvae]